MFNKNDKIHKRSIKKIDAVVTGMLLGGIVASIYGIKKKVEHREEKQKHMNDWAKTWVKNILKMLIFWVKKTTTPEKKPGFFSRFFKK